MHDKPVGNMPPVPLALLFDLGGVVIDIDFRRAFSLWQPGSGLSLEEIAKAFKFDLQYQRHERGEMRCVRPHRAGARPRRGSYRLF